jgi:hypothetical protein
METEKRRFGKNDLLIFLYTDGLPALFAFDAKELGM